MTKKGIKQMAYRHPVGAMRLVCGAFFLALLGVCGYIGAERTHVQSVVSSARDAGGIGGRSRRRQFDYTNQRKAEPSARRRIDASGSRDRGCRRRQRGKGGCAVAKDADSAPNGNGSSKRQLSLREWCGKRVGCLRSTGRNAAYSTGNGDGRNGQEPAAERSRRAIRDRNDTTKNHSHQKISKLELYTDEKSAILMNIHREVFLK